MSLDADPWELLASSVLFLGLVQGRLCLAQGFQRRAQVHARQPKLVFQRFEAVLVHQVGRKQRSLAFEAVFQVFDQKFLPFNGDLLHSHAGFGLFDLGNGTERLGLATWDGSAWVDAVELDSQILDINDITLAEVAGAARKYLAHFSNPSKYGEKISRLL